MITLYRGTIMYKAGKLEQFFRHSLKVKVSHSRIRTKVRKL